MTDPLGHHSMIVLTMTVLIEESNRKEEGEEDSCSDDDCIPVSHSFPCSFLFDSILLHLQSSLTLFPHSSLPSSLFTPTIVASHLQLSLFQSVPCISLPSKLRSAFSSFFYATCSDPYLALLIKSVPLPFLTLIVTSLMNDDDDYLLLL